MAYVVNEVLVAVPVIPVAAAVSVQPANVRPPTLCVMLTPLNVATPAPAVTGLVVTLSVAPGPLAGA